MPPKEDGANALLILVAGLPATGKTTFAEALAERLGARHFNSDIIRIGEGLQGQYDSETKKKVYDLLFDQTEQALRLGKIVIVDATFYKSALRRPFEELAQKVGCRVVWVKVKAPREVVRERMQRKRAYSEADFDVYQQIDAEYEELDKPYLSLPSDRLSLEEMIDRTSAYLKKVK